MESEDSPELQDNSSASDRRILILLLLLALVLVGLYAFWLGAFDPLLPAG